MAKKPLPLRIDEDLLRRVDVERKRLGQTRTLFVERALESALSGQRSGDTRSVSSPRESGSVEEVAPTESSAPSRAHARPLGKGFVPPRPKLNEERKR